VSSLKTSRFPAEFPMFEAPVANLSTANGALSPVAASVAGHSADFWGANHPSKM